MPSESTAAAADRQFLNELVTRLYKDLRRLAAKIRWSSSSKSPTELVHEAYLKLIKAKDLASKPEREVIGIFANAMEQILADAARRKRTDKRGGKAAIIPLVRQDGTSLEPPARKEPISPEQFLTLKEAIAELAQKDPDAAQIVKCRRYLGMTTEETARVFKASTATIERADHEARRFLEARLRPPE